jgi:hypothetical protein
MLIAVATILATTALGGGTAFADEEGTPQPTPTRTDKLNYAPTEMALASPSAVATRPPASWEERTLFELADSLAWPTTVVRDNSGKVTIQMPLAEDEWSLAAVRPFDYEAAAEAAFSAEQEDARLAGFQVSSTVYGGFPAYIAMQLTDGDQIAEKRLHWLVECWIAGIDVRGTSDTARSLDVLEIGRSLTDIGVRYGMPAPPDGTFPSPVPTQGFTPSVTPTSQSCGVTFDDVPTWHWAHGYISDLACGGIVGGYTDGTFRPQNPTTRAQLAKMIVLAEDWALANPESATFPDVDPSHIFFRYIETAYARGVISGFEDGSFRPDAYVKRAQVAKMLVKARGWSRTIESPVVLCDVKAGHWAYEYVQVAIQHNVFTGYGNGCFYPDAYATRAQLAKVLVQAYR